MIQTPWEMNWDKILFCDLTKMYHSTEAWGENVSHLSDSDIRPQAYYQSSPQYGSPAGLEVIQVYKDCH